ncbi:hypothetical protein ACFL5O_03830 [Myxococcota bacterium]
MQPLVNTSIQPVWTSIRAIRDTVGQALAQYPSEFAGAAVMVASELLENSVKYGEAVTAARVILFALGASDGQLRIETVNGSTDVTAVHGLVSRVRLIRKTEDKGSLYLARLQELLTNPSVSAQLGIYRIAFEGQFELDCTYENDVVTVVATRGVPDGIAS